MNALILRWDAPLMSFGTVQVDAAGPTGRFPFTSQITGLLANALGWQHRDTDRLQDLQAHLIYAARWDHAGSLERDYQTVDLYEQGNIAWTTRGVPETRTQDTTVERIRFYWADGLLTVALHVVPSPDRPTLDALQQALAHPARPLFLGRKACLPARPLLDPHMPQRSGPDILTILRTTSIWTRDGQLTTGPRAVSWPAETPGPPAVLMTVADQRAWRLQVHTGEAQRAVAYVEGLADD